ncbi:MAG: hypothetical protein LBU31_04145 [Coriobacteriales bacterium]|nr:hypothetical protein [Coriobacteriales bacterium]
MSWLLWLSRVLLPGKLPTTPVPMSAGVCWEQRGCDAEMASYCPHATASTDGVCPAECCYTACQCEQRQLTADIDLLLDPTVERKAAIKENCRNCAFFLTHAPRRA